MLCSSRGTWSQGRSRGFIVSIRRPARLENHPANTIARVEEIVPGIYRISTPPGDQFPIGFNQFLIADEKPALIHTGFYQAYDAVRSAVAEVLDPKQLSYIVLG